MTGEQTSEAKPKESDIAIPREELDQIKMFLKKKGLRQEHLAKGLGIGPSHMSRMLSGARGVIFPERQLRKLYESLGRPPELDFCIDHLGGADYIREAVGELIEKYHIGDMGLKQAYSQAIRLVYRRLPRDTREQFTTGLDKFILEYAGKLEDRK